MFCHLRDNAVKNPFGIREWDFETFAVVVAELSLRGFCHKDVR